MSFEKACEYLERIGAGFQQDYDYGKQGTEERHEFDVKVFTSVYIPFTPVEWVNLCMREGGFYIGGCCGTSSAAQDVISDCFRLDSGWLACSDLETIADLLNTHEEDSDAAYRFDKLEEPLDQAVQHAWERWSELDPWEKMALIWHIVKDHYNPKVPVAPRRDLPPMDLATQTVTRVFTAFSLNRLFERESEDPGAESQRLAQNTLLLAKLLPALKTINEQIDTLNFGGFEGFALIDKSEGPTAVAQNGRGPCLFRTQEEVDHLLAQWRKNEAKYEEKTARVGKIDDRIAVRRVRVSKEKGVEFLDEAPSMPTE